ncbi:MAG TPA: metal-dependent hydrolase [Nitrospira sp.]|nr:metal-dependent hydrolase [Nitrospira sp.]
MASAFSHAIVALTIGKACQNHLINWRALLLGVACSILPDVDVIGFRYGIQYGDVWGHRGLTHSLLFAVLLSAVLAVAWYRKRPKAAMAGMCVYLFLCTASHGVLDAMTSGGFGVAFFSPFDTTRYFFSFRPIAVSPISIDRFFSEDGLHILFSEAKWIWLPSCAVFLVLRTIQRSWSGTHVAQRPQRD